MMDTVWVVRVGRAKRGRHSEGRDYKLRIESHEVGPKQRSITLPRLVDGEFVFDVVTFNLDTEAYLSRETAVEAGEDAAVEIANDERSVIESIVAPSPWLAAAHKRIDNDLAAMLLDLRNDQPKEGGSC